MRGFPAKGLTGNRPSGHILEERRTTVALAILASVKYFLCEKAQGS